MAIFLLDNSLKVEIFFDSNDNQYEDNIRISFVEECPEDEKIFLAGETNIYLTPEQACELAEALNQAIKDGERFCSENR